MNRQLRYPLIFLVAFFLWATSLRPPIVKTFIPESLSTLPTMPVLLSPSSSIGANYSPTYTWGEAAGVTWYHLWVGSANTDGSISTIYDEWHNASVVCLEAICAVTPALTLPPGNYKWSIQIWNDFEFGTWSSEMDFSTSMQGATYYVSLSGDDSNLGTQASPWRTIQKAAETVVSGDTVFVRGGEYSTVGGSPTFKNSGTETQPITLRNYPGEQVLIRLEGNPAFFCWWQSTTQGQKVNHIRILGTYVTARVLSNGVTSWKGIVIQGKKGEQIHGINGHGCDFWEIGGVDFVDVGSGIFNFKKNNRQNVDNSADHWYVHDNRVYRFYRESGMQFNTDNNRIENNRIYKVTNRVDTPYGCQLLNVLGDSNTIRGNILSRQGSTADCTGMLFEWDLADANLVEQNRIFDVTGGIDFQGGDHNVIRNNIIYISNPLDPGRAGIGIFSYSYLKSDWPCNEETGSAQELLPPNDASHPDYQYYYNPRNCRSFGNQIYNNVVHQFPEGIRLYPLVGKNTIIRNNIFSGWTRGGICHYNSSNGTCYPLPVTVIADHNAEQGHFGFADIKRFDFHLTLNSFLIDAGYDLGSLNPNDFDGNPRPQRQGFDIGAYEFIP